MMEHKGYLARTKFDDEANVFHGEVINIRDVITFQGKSVGELRQAFEDSVEDYLAFCAERGEGLDKPFELQAKEVRVMMTKLLEEAFAKATKLPEREQDALATIILEELASERRWEKAFAGSSDVLAQLADEALAEHRDCRRALLLMGEKIVELLRTLPSIVACIVWDVFNENVTPKTIELADSVTEEEWEEYDIVRCIAAGNPEYPPVEEAQVLVEMMIEALAYQPA